MEYSYYDEVRTGIRQKGCCKETHGDKHIATTIAHFLNKGISNLKRQSQQNVTKLSHNNMCRKLLADDINATETPITSEALHAKKPSRLLGKQPSSTGEMIPISVEITNFQLTFKRAT